MIAFLCFLLGVLLTLMALAGWAMYLALTEPPPTADHLSRLTQLQAEQQLHRLRQEAVTQLLQAVRREG